MRVRQTRERTRKDPDHIELAWQDKVRDEFPWFTEEDIMNSKRPPPKRHETPSGSDEECPQEEDDEQSQGEAPAG